MKFKVMPPTYLFIFLLLSVAAHFICPIKQIVFAPYAYLGVLLIFAGSIVSIWSDNLFKKKSIPIKPHDNPAHFETSGPFHVSRNPMYLGMAMILLGTSLLLGSLITFIFPLIFVVLMDRVFITFEERNLEDIFKKEYLEYLSLLAETGCCFSFGSDAHRLPNLKFIESVWDFAGTLNLTPDRIWQPDGISLTKSL